MSEVFPVNDYGPIMPGLVMAGVAIVHVFLAQFAVGGGILLCYFQWLAMTGREIHARPFVKGYFKLLVLISFVVGALTGVGIWFTAIQVSPATIGSMVDHFHWLWATEWTFFCLEIVAGYCFYRYHQRLNDRAAMTLLAIYAFASWVSLFVINGILSWQLTPGRWLESHRLFDGFFNPSFWPSLFFRTVVAMTLAALAACVVINLMNSIDRDGRRALINRAAHLLVPMVAMPILGIWFLAVMPEDSRSWVLGGSPAMMLFLSLSIASSLAIGSYAILGLVIQRLYVNGATASLLLLLAFGATAGGEFVREGSRKPYSIRHVLYSNSILPDEVAHLREVGCTSNDPYPLRNDAGYANDQVRLGAKVFRRQCSVCHTMQGTNAVAELTGAWDANQMRMNFAKLQHTKPFMPPFAGTARELESLVQFVRWTSRNDRSSRDWELSENPETLAQIEVWLNEAGTAPGDFKQNHRRGVSRGH
ncbi:c-type cytochrome [Schlesneria paludicola]|uniref:c-type cytochrome n=1 Tax=Schlesneria paludicola TaxID=360056 RepID=UPI00029A0D37|nr:c-type cytochrome [Schlesneria paludicola]